MRRILAFLVVASAGLLVAGSAAGATVESGSQDVDVDTAETTCQLDATACQSPSVDADVSIRSPSFELREPNRGCLDTLAETGGEADRCDPGGTDPSQAMISAKLTLRGLDDRSDDEPATQSQQAAPSSEDGTGFLGTEMEAALLLGALGLGASGMAAWVGLKRLATVFLAPLASRLQRSELLENDKRRNIYEKIQEDPGVNLRGLADELDLAWGTLLHHLRKLEDNHLVTSERYGKYRRFFLNGSTYSEEEQARLAALSTPSTARVAEYILENPGANQSEIGDAIGVAPSTILFHVRRLKDVDLVEVEREGRYVHYYPLIEDHEAQQMATA